MTDIKRITIVHIITDLGVGGAERVLSNLVMHMDRDKFKNIIVSLQDLGYWGTILQQAGIEVHAMHLGRNLSAIKQLINLWRLLRRTQPDYIQGWMYHANVVALIMGRMAGIKKIYWNIRCSLMDLAKYRFTTTLVFKLGAWLARFPTGIITNSHAAMRQHIAKGYRNKNWLYIPNGFAMESFKPDQGIYAAFRREHNLPAEAIIIGMIARYDPMKDHATFVQAAGILAAELPNVYFLCAGRNVNFANSQIKKLVSQYDLENRILLLDQVENMQNLYPALDYLTQTSIFGEGFPNVVAEAMACGVECFVTDVGDSLDVIGTQGYSIPMQDPQALAASWKNVIIKRSSTEKLAPRNRILHNFALEKIVHSYAECYGVNG